LQIKDRPFGRLVPTSRNRVQAWHAPFLRNPFRILSVVILLGTGRGPLRRRMVKYPKSHASGGGASFDSRLGYFRNISPVGELDLVDVVAVGRIVAGLIALYGAALVGFAAAEIFEAE
jgi:hypothetical protein